MVALAQLPISHLGDAPITTAYVLNYVPVKSVVTTSHELWASRKPDLSVLSPLGCALYGQDSSHKYGKLGLRRKKCIFIRYSKTSKWYVFIRLEESGSITKFKSRDVIFLENEFPKKD